MYQREKVLQETDTSYYTHARRCATGDTRSEEHAQASTGSGDPRLATPCAPRQARAGATATLTQPARPRTRKLRNDDRREKAHTCKVCTEYNEHEKRERKRGACSRHIHTHINSTIQTTATNDSGSPRSMPARTALRAVSAAASHSGGQAARSAAPWPSSSTCARAAAPPSRAPRPAQPAGARRPRCRGASRCSAAAPACGASGCGRATHSRGGSRRTPRCRAAS
mmetsp:Transcript_58699/g.161077  ORF Transcript_58699/g.161077 Transcript_58699/m.161077 type:complete len:225 (-) Transcript_58699:90-764(-)